MLKVLQIPFRTEASLGILGFISYSQWSHANWCLHPVVWEGLFSLQMATYSMPTPTIPFSYHFIVKGFDQVSGLGKRMFVACECLPGMPQT